MTMRPLTTQELEAIKILASEVGSDELRKQIFADLSHCMVREEAPDASRLMFHIDGYDWPRYEGQDTFRGSDGFPVEGGVKDVDGDDIDVIIYVVDGRIFELELLRHDGESLIGPDWSTFGTKAL